MKDKYKSRYYQTEAIDALYNYFNNFEGNPIVAMPGGTGKSVVISNFIRGIYQNFPTQRVMMLTHVKELIEQNFEKLTTSWPTAPAGIYSAGVGRKDTHCKITFAGIQSVAKKWELFGHQDLIIIDECHLVSDNDEAMYYSFIEHLKGVNPYLKVIGFTATKWRLGMGLLTNGKIFTDIAYDNTTLEGFTRLIDEGFLSPLVPKRTQYEIDVEDIPLVGKEFSQKASQAKMDKDEVTYEALKECISEGHDRLHWMVFCTGTDHCDNTADALEELGISAVSVHSKKGAAANDKAIRDFKAGRVRALVNNNKLTTGFDYPNVDMEVILRPSKSSSLWVQILSRGTRPVYAEGFDLSTTAGRLAAIAAGPKQNCLVMDFVGNTKRLGPINDPLIPAKKGKGRGGGIAPVRECPKCRTLNHASAVICMSCGFVFPKAVNIRTQAATDELIASGMPVVKEFKVTKVTYAIHKKMDRPDSMKVTYYCGLTKYTSYCCPEHGGAAGKRFARWWKQRAETEVPESTFDAVDRLKELTEPSHVRVWLKKKHPEVMAVCINEEFV